MKTIRIPRIKEGHTFPVEIIKGQSNRGTLTLKSQTIEGVKIPKGSIINCWNDNYNFNHSGDVCSVPIEFVNRLLKYLYLEELRKQ